MDDCAEKNRLFRTIRDIEMARDLLGITMTDVKFLELAVRFVAPQDCADGSTPYWYGRVDDMAYELRVSPRTVNNIEKRLERAGLVHRHRLANGHRRGLRDRATGRLRAVHGVSLAPLIERCDDLAGMAEVIRAADRRFRQAREAVLQARGRLKTAITNAAPYPALAELRAHTQAILDSHPDRITRQHQEADELERIALSLAVAAEALDSAVDNITKTVDVDDEVSDASEIHCRHKYDTTPRPSYSCRNIRTPPNGGDSDSLVARPNGRDCRENKDRAAEAEHNPENRFNPDNFSISKVARTLPPEWQSLLGPCPVSWDVLPELAEAMVPQLGIGNHLWLKARREIGVLDAAIAVLILDRNRQHPTHPVGSPGASLTGMLKNAARGELRLEASLHGLIARSVQC